MVIGVTKKGFALVALGCISVGSIGVYAQCNEELGIGNGSFSDKDGAGAPLEWKIPNAEKTGMTVTIDEEEYHTAPGSIKLEFTEGYTGEGGPQVAQGIDKTFLSSIPAGTEFTAKAWIKTKDVPPMGGFQLVAHNGATLPGPPWFKPIAWQTWASGSGTEDWHEVSGTFTKATAEVTNINIFLYFKSSMPATVWVDDLEICTGESDIQHVVSKNIQSRNIVIQNHMVKFHQSTNYQAQILSPNGRQVAFESGFGKTLNLNKSGIASGCYIVNIKSDVGSLTQPFVFSKTK